MTSAILPSRTLRIGAEYTCITGVLHYDFGRVASCSRTARQGPSPEQQPAIGLPDVAGELKVTSLNTLNFHERLDDGSLSPKQPRAAWRQTPQRADPPACGRRQRGRLQL